MVVWFVSYVNRLYTPKMKEEKVTINGLNDNTFCLINTMPLWGQKVSGASVAMNTGRVISHSSFFLRKDIMYITFSGENSTG